MEYNSIHIVINYLEGVIVHLGEYLKSNKITQEEFLKRMEETTGESISQGGLSKYVQGKRIPKKEVMMMIYHASDKKVQPNDFYLYDSTTG